MHDPFNRPTEVLCGLSELRQLSDEAGRLLIISAEGEDSLIGGVGGGATLTGQGGVVEGESLGLDGQTGCEFIIQQATGCLRE